MCEPLTNAKSQIASLPVPYLGLHVAVIGPTKSSVTSASLT
jgi:hypothetical protein